MLQILTFTVRIQKEVLCKCPIHFHIFKSFAESYFLYCWPVQLFITITLLCLTLKRLYLCLLQVFLVKKISGPDAKQLYAMKVLKKATLKGKLCNL